MLLYSFLFTLTLWLNYGIQYQALKCHNLCEYLKFVEIDNILVLGNVESEKCFSTLKFLKSSFYNRLNVHPPMVVQMFQQKKITLANFPYKEAIESWKSENKWYGDSWVIIITVVVSFETWPNFQILMNPFSFHDFKPIFWLCYNL